MVVCFDRIRKQRSGNKPARRSSVISTAKSVHAGTVSCSTNFWGDGHVCAQTLSRKFGHFVDYDEKMTTVTIFICPMYDVHVYITLRSSCFCYCLGRGSRLSRSRGQRPGRQRPLHRPLQAVRPVRGRRPLSPRPGSTGCTGSLAAAAAAGDAAAEDGAGGNGLR